MAVELTNTSKSFVGTGISSVYAPEFYANSSDQVYVTVDGVLQALGDDYVLDGLGNAAGIQITATFANGSAVFIERSTQITQEVDTQNNETILEDVLDGEFDKLTMIAQEINAGLARAFLVQKGQTGSVIDKTLFAGKYYAGDAGGDLVPASGTGNDSALRTDLANGTTNGDRLVGHKEAFAGAVATTLFNIISRDRIKLDSEFGTVDRTGATDVTAQVKSFINAMLNEPWRGGKSGGKYKVTLGQLAFDNNQVDTPFIDWDTGGFQNTILVAAANADAAFLSFTNGTAVSGAGRFWQGGRIGGIQFLKAAGSAAAFTNMHGLNLRGFFQTNFGLMATDAIGGDAGHAERKLFGGSNPDPYHIAFCYFEGFQTLGGRFAFNNDNYVGFNGNWIDKLYSAGATGGGYKGYGAANTVRVASLDCLGWAFSDNTDGLGGGSRSFRLLDGELDAVEFGIDVDRLMDSQFACRLNHTFEAGPALCFPKTSLRLAAGGIYVSNCDFHLIHRINPGCTKPTIGKFVDFSSAGGAIGNVYIKHRLDDNAGLGLTNADLVSGFNANSKARYTDNNDLPIVDTIRSMVTARALTTFTVPNGGFGGGSNFIPYATEFLDPMIIFNPATGLMTFNSYGSFRIEVSHVLTFASAGIRVRLAAYLNGVSNKSVYRYSQTTNAELYGMWVELDVQPGDTLQFNIDQNSGAGVNFTTFLANNDNFLVAQSLR